MREQLLREFADQKGLFPEEVEALARMLAKQFPNKRVVSPHEFLTNTHYLNAYNSDGSLTLYPVVAQHFCELNSGDYNEAVLTGGIGAAKTTLALYTIAYQVYLLSCYDDPHGLFGLDSASELLFVFQSVNERIATSVDYLRFKGIIDRSPYFRKKFPYDPSLKSELRFPHRIVVKPTATTVSGAIGQNLVGGLIDEVNFLSVVEKSKRSLEGGVFDQAKAIYDVIDRRRKSRFLHRGTLPGILCLSSSKRYPGEFTDQKIAEAQLETARTGRTSIYVYDKRVWDVKPPGSFSNKYFRVFVGDLSRKPRILEGQDDVAPNDLHLVTEVPEDYRFSFESDIYGAIRDIAGVSTLVRHPYMVETEKVVACFNRHPSVLNREVVDFAIDNMVFYPARFREKEKPRWVHIDLGLTGDSAGVACGYVTGFTSLLRGSVVEQLPLVHIDFLLRVVPPKNGEIAFYRIRELIYKLRSAGLPIRWASLDSFQCVAGNTRILTHRGMIPACEVKKGDVVQSRIGPRPVTQTWAFGKKPCLRIRTSDGQEIVVTHKHKLEMGRTWRYTGYEGKVKGRRKFPSWEWVSASEIQAGDVIHAWDRVSSVEIPYQELIAVPREANALFHRLPGKLDEHFAEFLGVLWGDGYIGRDGIQITAAEGEVKAASHLIVREFHRTPHVRKHKDRNCSTVEFSSRVLVSWLKANGLVKSDAIPEPLWRSPKTVQVAFLRGLFSTDGSVCPFGGCTFSTRHKVWADFVQMVLRSQYGIEASLSRISREHHPGYETDAEFQYVVHVRGGRSVFESVVGFCYPTKVARLAVNRDRPGRSFWTKVVEVTETEAEVYDFEVEEDHSYIANGLVSHNSRDTIQLLRQQGFSAGLVSIDTSCTPYEYTKSALYDGRLVIPPHRVCQTELLGLEYDARKDKVDHSEAGSKDVADALAGVVYGLTTRREIWGQFGITPVNLPESLHAAVKKNEQAVKPQ